jgi:hypothetical protein
LPHQRRPGVPGPKWSQKPVGLRWTSLHVTPCDCHICRASDNPSSPARQRPHTTSSRAEARVHPSTPASAAWENGGCTVLQVRPHPRHRPLAQKLSSRFSPGRRPPLGHPASTHPPPRFSLRRRLVMICPSILLDESRCGDGPPGRDRLGLWGELDMPGVAESQRVVPAAPRAEIRPDRRSVRPSRGHSVPQSGRPGGTPA